MKTLKIRLITTFLLSIVILAGCGSRGSEFLGTWVNTSNADDTFQVVRNGDQYLVVSGTRKVGATYDKGTLEIKGMLGSTNFTYDRKSDSILTLGLFGQAEYRRKK